MTIFGGTSRVIRDGALNHLKPHQRMLALRLLLKRGIVKYGHEDFPRPSDDLTQARRLPNPDVIRYCVGDGSGYGCGLPIFNQSQNVSADGSTHRRCPNRP